MKICLYSDNHWSQYSSIVRKRGEKFSLRLENQIQSINWVMRLAEDKKCIATLCCGDFFNKSDLNAEEISALKEVRWAGMTNFFIAGNHEMGTSDHRYSSIKLFNLIDTGEVITQPQTLSFSGNTEICILPYILENDRKPLAEYFPARTGKKRIIFSHNDIAGIQMGRFISETGFSVEEISENCDLFINGHLHNGGNVTNKIINIGNLTGENFSEDAGEYTHYAFIVDTDTFEVEKIENPYAFNFYKLDITRTGFPKNLKTNSVCTIKCRSKDIENVKEWALNNSHIVEHRVVVEPEVQMVTENLKEELSIDHLKAFREYMLNNLENTKELMEELSEVLR